MCLDQIATFYFMKIEAKTLLKSEEVSSQVYWISKFCTLSIVLFLYMASIEVHSFVIKLINSLANILAEQSYVMWTLFTSFLITFIFKRLFDKLIGGISEQRALFTEGGRINGYGSVGQNAPELQLKAIEDFLSKLNKSKVDKFNDKNCYICF